ncbi:MAG: phosphatidylinositol transfer protein, partial [Myxococcales bacterium]|nr:phosphatidylinositol transfer protein [Myxococcales bacterium]
TDAGTTDAGPGPGDAGSTPLDGGPGPSDAGVDAGPSECTLPPACDAPLPDLGATTDWRHTSSRITAAIGSPRHRGRDLFLTDGDAQWALAKFAYGIDDDDIKDEDVDIYLLRGCEGSWEHLGVATTTYDGDHATVEGVEDTGGRVYFEIPAAQRLGRGRHRLLFVVQADHSVAEQYIEVVAPGTRFAITDVDGTQTESENAEFGAIFSGATVNAQPHGDELMTAFARRGYRPFYLTARPEWLHTRTVEWLAENGYPAGVVHTTLTFTGGTGMAAIDFKTAELAALLARFPDSIEVSIGNTDTDTAAFVNASIPPERAWLYQYDPGADGTRVDDYATQIPVAEAAPLACFE